jgi:hypothetical protein
MTEIDIFISYKNERRKAAEHLAAVLRLCGYSVWFDYQLVKGSDFGLQIDSKIREAQALVALWCSLSVSSRWVMEEVDLAHERGILIPVKIEPCDLPVGFRRQDYIDLSSWDGSPRSHQLDPLIKALEQCIGRPALLDLKGVREYEAIWDRFGAPSLKAFALGKPLADVEGDRQVLSARTSPSSSMPSVAVLPIDHRHELMVMAAREWPTVRDSADPQRLERFERYFAGTFYAEEAGALRERIEPAMKRQNAANADRQRRYRARRKAERQAREAVVLAQGAASNVVENS